jgi:hypothetical protein
LLMLAKAKVMGDYEVMNTLSSGEEAFKSLETLGNKIGWYDYGTYYDNFGKPREVGTIQTQPLALPDLTLPEGYEPGTGYVRVYETRIGDRGVSWFHSGVRVRGTVEETSAVVRGLSVGAERAFDMDTAIFKQVEISELAQPDEQTLKTLSEWVMRLSEVIDQK